MNKHIFRVSVLTMIVAMAQGHRLPVDMDNTIDGGQTTAVKKDWVEVSRAPPARVAKHSGHSVELECEVFGQPTPTVRWFHGSAPSSNFDDFETNLISESSLISLTWVRARIIIDHPIASERTYTCMGQAGNRKTFVTTIVYPADEVDDPVAELPSTKMLANLKPARILHYYEAIFEVIGSNLILPCHTSGRPRAEVYWMNEESIVIGDQEPRFKTLPTGELIITSLRWSDMGLYTCVAKNAIAKDTINTFIYPMKPNEA